MEIGARLAQLLLQHGRDAKALGGDQHLEPQCLRALVEGAVAHLHRARVPDAITYDVYGELRPGESLEIGGARTRYVEIGLRAPARRRANDARVEEAPTG